MNAVSTARALPASGLTEVELTWIEKRHEYWLRFGRIATDRFVNRRTRIACVRASSVFALVRWSSNDHGTVHSSIDIVQAVQKGEPYTTLPNVHPGGDILLHIRGWPKVQQVLAAIDAVEAEGIDPCDVAPDHWRHVSNRLSTGIAFRAYTPERHAAWLRRKAIEA